MTAQRCLFVVTHFCPLVGGAQTVYDALARQLPDRFQVLTSERDYTTGQIVEGYQQFDASAPYKIMRLSRTRPEIGGAHVGTIERIRNFVLSRLIQRRLINSILDICERESIDVICVGASDALTWLPATLRKRTDRKIVYYTHGEEFSQDAHSARAKAMRVSAIANSDGVVAVSSFTRNLLIERYGASEQRTALIHNGVDFERFASKNGPPSKFLESRGGGKIVVAAGRMVERKGFDKLIEAWPSVLERNPSSKLLIAGKGPLFSTLEKRIGELGVAATIQQLGYVPDEQLVQLYQSADLFVMPNRTLPNGDTEGFGLVFLEAAAAGTPSVGGHAGGATDAIIHGKTGLLIDGESVSEIADAVSRLLQDDQEREAMAKAAYLHAQRCDWHTKAQELLDFFSELPTPVR